MFRLLAVAPLALTLLATTGPAVQSAPNTTVFDVSDLATGAPPKIVWTEQSGSDSVIHSGERTTTVNGSISAVAPMGSGYVVQTADESRVLTRWVGADGSPGRSSWRTGFGLATSPDGQAVAFTTRRGGVKVIDQEADRVLSMPSIPSREFGQAAYVSRGDCKEDETSNGCAVFVNSRRSHRSWVVSSHGLVDTAGFKAVSAGRGRWLGGVTNLSDAGSCSAMKRGLKVRWRTCDNAFGDISPDTRHVLGTPAYADGFGPTTLDVLDLRTGAVEQSFRSTRKVTTTFFDEVWEDASHVLVVTHHNDEFAVVRLGLDGSMEYAVPPVPASDDLSVPFRLQTR